MSVISVLRKCSLAALGTAAVLFFSTGRVPASTITFVWPTVTNSPVTGYRLYCGTASQVYTTSYDAGNATQFTVSGLSNGVTYYFAVKSYNAVLESPAYSPEVSVVPDARGTLDPLVFAAASGTITAPFIVTNGVIYQTSSTGYTNGGRAVYTFTLDSAGPYTVSASINAPASGSRSLYLNMDADPNSATMIWDAPVLSGFVTRTASWRGTGTQNTPQFSPKIFTLTAGTHQLILRGKDPNVQLSSITVSPAYPVVKLQILSGNVLVSGVGPIGKNYDLLASQNLTTWTPIQSITMDLRGTFSMVDAAAAGLGSRYYRLRASGP